MHTVEYINIKTNANGMTFKRTEKKHICSRKVHYWSINQKLVLNANPKAGVSNPVARVNLMCLNYLSIYKGTF